MKYFNILLMIGALLGGIVGAVVEVPSYAGSNVIVIPNDGYGIGRYVYFPNTGYIVHTNNGTNLSSFIAKYVLPKNLSINSVQKLKGVFPGTIMSMTAAYRRTPTSKWEKSFSQISINKANSSITTKGVVYAVAKSYEIKINSKKMDVLYNKGRQTWKQSNTATQDFESIFR
jgi:hypothetical protein